MVQLKEIKAANVAFVKSQPLVAVFVGGTSGISNYTVKTLAATHGDSGKGLRLYIVGRNKESADKTIAECQRVCPHGQFYFVQVDATLLRNVDRACAEFVKLEEAASNGEPAHIDILMMSIAWYDFGDQKCKLLPPLGPL